MRPSSAEPVLLFLKRSTHVRQVHQIHAHIITCGLPFQGHIVTKLVELHHVSYARKVFDQMGDRDDYLWTCMIKACTAHGIHEESCFLYCQMLENGFKPTKFTYPFVFKACSVIGATDCGHQAHAQAIRSGLKSDIFVSNSLVDMYCKFFCVESAHRIFDEMRERDEVSWNSLIAGCVHCGDVETAREIFDNMPERRNVVSWTAMINGYGRQGMVVEMFNLFRFMLVSNSTVSPNSTTMVCLLTACSVISNLELGKWISAFIYVNGFHLNIFLRTALLDMYAKCGDIQKAREVFDCIPCKSLICWNAMITGYVHGGYIQEAVDTFHRMQMDHVDPNEVTMVSLLSACASSGALEFGRKIHLYLQLNRLELNVILATALVDMYSKCGSINDAFLMFLKTGRKDVVIWNAMIAGFAAHGCGKDCLMVFDQMIRNETTPNEVTFLGVLSACDHMGLVDEGRACFEMMQEKYKLIPGLEHYACMVDLLGRFGHLDEALKIISVMSVGPDSFIWSTLLNACKIHGNVKFADKVGELMLTSENLDLGSCILLSNIYAEVNRWLDVAKIRRLIRQTGMKKALGCSWIEVFGVVHRFLVEDTTHPQCSDIYWMLGTLIKEAGYGPYIINIDPTIYYFDTL